MVGGPSKGPDCAQCQGKRIACASLKSAPEAQWLLAPRFSVGLAKPTITRSPVGTALRLHALLTFFPGENTNRERLA